MGIYKTSALSNNPAPIATITEPSGGSDMMAMRTTAVADGDDFVLNGSKAFVSNGSIAGLIMVYARTGEAGDVAGITTFLIRRDTPGLAVGQPVRKMGLRTSPLTELFLQDVRVPRDHVVGGVGGEDECGVGVVELARDGEHLCFRQTVRVEHDAGRISGEALAGEGIDLMNLDLSRHRSSSPP